MKASIVIICLATSVSAQWCNYGWGRPSNGGCNSQRPNTYCCNNQNQQSNTFPVWRDCRALQDLNHQGSLTQYIRPSCGATGTIYCC
ncbi:hypothetical protein ACET3X_005532 [Alternaria dauci]|uniref:Uncharacterized protein n=1 Tax=Alternaria dauci TaxID=48095 RepID=A0ABR3UL84_9PLEO